MDNPERWVAKRPHLFGWVLRPLWSFERKVAGQGLSEEERHRSMRNVGESVTITASRTDCAFDVQSNAVPSGLQGFRPPDALLGGCRPFPQNPQRRIRTTSAILTGHSPNRTRGTSRNPPASMVSCMCSFNTLRCSALVRVARPFSESPTWYLLKGA